MNDSINIIANQVCGTLTNEDWDIPQEFIERFSTALIKECAYQIRLKGTDWLDWEPSKLAIRPEYAEMAEHLKQHFGVQ